MYQEATTKRHEFLCNLPYCNIYKREYNYNQEEGKSPVKENKDMIRKIKKTMRITKMIMEFENLSFLRALKEAREEIKDYEEQIEFENEANR